MHSFLFIHDFKRAFSDAHRIITANLESDVGISASLDIEDNEALFYY